MSSPVPDLFDFLVTRHEEWKTSGGTVNIAGRPVSVDVPAGDAEFPGFCRSYLSKNPVVASGQVSGEFGVTLACGAQVVLSRGMLPVMDDRAGAIAVSGRFYEPPMPPSGSIPITGG